ncbi:hypothetical protein B9479_006738 [Cryptococcus floricola]|uniref:FAD dependent oxidoreductase domain-containing protein n=1 Tax=Cryptococcus floricola TaxID=2591691 RepID=A0A5D3ASB9_9TREE|nr:hypothetical protein B9479_006738 [Cryptococcus floricola]
MTITTTTPARKKITILGSGVTGLTIAMELCKDYHVEILARDMPNDPDSLGWSSPWAGAIWFGLDGSNAWEQAMQRVSYEKFIALAEKEPESSIVKTGFYDYQDKYDKPDETHLWYTDLPGFRYVTGDEDRTKKGITMFYQSIVLNPHKYLPYLRQKLESQGVTFTRHHSSSLSSTHAAHPSDLLINATGNGSKFLIDVNDQNCEMVRGQVMLVKCDAKDVHIRHGDQYTYVLPRGDGTAVLGGIKETSLEPAPQDWLRRDIHKRCHELLPKHIPASFSDLEIIRDQVGFRPQRNGSVRLEAEQKKGFKVVHAYGVSGGGFVYSWGVAAEVAKVVQTTLAE